MAEQEKEAVLDADTKTEEYKNGYSDALRDNLVVTNKIYKRGLRDAIGQVVEILREYDEGASIKAHILADSLEEEFSDDES